MAKIDINNVKPDDNLDDLTDRQVRQIIKSAAAEQGARYRISRDGTVHFYGKMPNANRVGWYWVDKDPFACAAMILFERANQRERR